MDLTPWQRINPCGLGVPMTQLADIVDNPPDIQQVMTKLADFLTAGLGYNGHQIGPSMPVLEELH
jgi:lipoyl(octanoyl) transferase